MIKKYYKKYKEIINYLIVGFLTTLLNLAVYFILTITIFDPNNPIELQISNVIAWIVGVVFAYITNRKYVFESKSDKITSEFIKFTSGRVVTLLMDVLIMFVGVSLLHFNDRIIKIISQIVVIVSNYIISKFIVFKKKELK